MTRPVVVSAVLSSDTKVNHSHFHRIGRVKIGDTVEFDSLSKCFTPVASSVLEWSSHGVFTRSGPLCGIACEPNFEIEKALETFDCKEIAQATPIAVLKEGSIPVVRQQVLIRILAEPNLEDWQALARELADPSKFGASTENLTDLVAILARPPRMQKAHAEAAKQFRRKKVQGCEEEARPVYHHRPHKKPRPLQSPPLPLGFFSPRSTSRDAILMQNKQNAERRAAASGTQSFEIFITDHACLTLQVVPSDTIAVLKTMIEEQVPGFPSDRQQLLIPGHSLTQDGRTLASYNVKANSRIILSRRQDPHDPTKHFCPGCHKGKRYLESFGATCNDDTPRATGMDYQGGSIADDGNYAQVSLFTGEGNPILCVIPLEGIETEAQLHASILGAAILHLAQFPPGNFNLAYKPNCRTIKPPTANLEEMYIIDPSGAYLCYVVL